MTKEDFQKKYHGKSVKIEVLAEIHTFSEMNEKPRRIQEMCKFMGLDAHQVTVPAPYLLVAIVDKKQESKTNNEVLTPITLISEEEFVADFKEAHEDMKFGKVKEALSEFNIRYGSITKLNKSSQNMKQVSEEGFIQGYTSNDASLWWHPMGRRLLFVRGEGVFELTDKENKEDNLTNI